MIVHTLHFDFAIALGVMFFVVTLAIVAGLLMEDAKTDWGGWLWRFVTGKPMEKQDGDRKERTPREALRAVAMDRAHLPDWMEIYKDPAVREQMYAAPVESETALWHYLQHRKFYSVFAGNDMVGGFSFYDVDGGLASFGIVLRSSFRGVKLGGELVRLMHETARQNGIRTLRADIYADNRSCLRLLENTGYRRFVWYEKNL